MQGPTASIKEISARPKVAGEFQNSENVQFEFQGWCHPEHPLGRARRPKRPNSCGGDSSGFSVWLLIRKHVQMIIYSLSVAFDCSQYRETFAGVWNSDAVLPWMVCPTYFGGRTISRGEVMVVLQVGGFCVNNVQLLVSILYKYFLENITAD